MVQVNTDGSGWGYKVLNNVENRLIANPTYHK